mgnify:CR=1 FL=1
MMAPVGRLVLVRTVDKRELVTLMTLGAQPEWLVLGYLRNQRLVASVEDIESITVDWDAGEDGDDDRSPSGRSRPALAPLSLIYL